MNKKIIIIFLISLAMMPSFYVKSENAEDYFQLGVHYYNMNEYDRSIYYFNKSIELNPYNDRNFFYRSLCYEKKENYVKAIEDYTTFKRLQVHDFEKHHYIAYWHNYYIEPLDKYYKRDYNYEGYMKGIIDFTNAIRQEPNNPHHYWRRGLLYYNLLNGNEEQNVKYALEDFNKAISLDPYNADYYFWRADPYCWGYGVEKDIGKAMEDYNKVVDLQPYHWPAYSNMGKIYYDIGNYSMAIDKYTKALEVHPTLYPLLYYRGMSYYNISDYTNARKDFDKIKKEYRVDCDGKNCYYGSYNFPDMHNSSGLGISPMAPIIALFAIFILLYIKRNIL